MLSDHDVLVLTDQNLEAHGSHALTSIVASGTATIGRSFGHSLRRAVSIRHSSASRYSRDLRPSSHHRHSAGPIAEEDSNRHSGTFVDLRPNSSYDPETASNRSSIISSSSVSTLSSSNPSASVLSGPSMPSGDRPHHLSAVQKVGSEGDFTSAPQHHLTSSPHYYSDTSSSCGSTSSLPLRAGGKSPVPGRAEGKSPQESTLYQTKQAPEESDPLGPNPVQPDASSCSSVESEPEPQESIHIYDTPL